MNMYIDGVQGLKGFAYYSSVGLGCFEGMFDSWNNRIFEDF